ncbi:MAG: hypothetical protein ACRDKT_14520 [Actinomycetota bacterium]
MKNRTIFARSHRFPLLMRLGFGLLGLALALDLAYHAVVVLGGGDPSHSGLVPAAIHGLVFAGMAVTFGGLLAFAIRPQAIVNRKERK